MFVFVFVCLALDSWIIDFFPVSLTVTATTARSDRWRYSIQTYWVTSSVAWVVSCHRLLPHGSVWAAGQWGIEETTDWTAAGRSGEWPRRSLLTGALITALGAKCQRGCLQQSFRDVRNADPEILSPYSDLGSASVNYTSWMTDPQSVRIRTVYHPVNRQFISSQHSP